MDFLNNLEILLERNNMSKSDLAQAINISPNTIYSWFSIGGNHINITAFKDISDYFNVSLDKLVKESITPSYNPLEINNDSLTTDFVSNVDILIKKHNMSRNEFSRAVNLAPSTVCAWFQQGVTRVGIDTLKNISKLFGVPIDTLINGSMHSTVSFSDMEFTRQELDALINFSKFLKENRVNNK